MYKVVIAPKAAKKIKTFPKQYQDSIRSALKELKEDPFIGKPLVRELSQRYSIPISNYRIIYTINIDNKVVSVVNADHRATVYN